MGPTAFARPATLTRVAAPEVPADLRERVERLLDEFGSWAVDDEAEALVARIDPTRLPVPALIRFTLADVLGLTDWGRSEKTAWEIPFVYRGTRCTIAHRKFGVRLSVGVSDEGEARKIADEIVLKLSKAVRVVEMGLLREYGERRVASGDITIVNQFQWLYGMYRHFRESAEASFAARRNENRREPPPGFAALARLLNRALTFDRTGAFNALAAINAYFSYLEHVLVLVLPFSDFDPGTESVTDFIGMRWRDKFKRVFDINGTTAKRLHDRLHEVSETYRNTYGHGGFDKEGGAIYFHVPGLGALPTRLTDVRESPHFELIPVDSIDFEEVCAVFDELDEFLRSSPRSRYGFRYAEAGMDVRFDASARMRFAEAMESVERFTIAMNMDW